MENQQQLNAARLAWHPAFVQAIKLELEQYGDKLEFKPEFPLTTEPLKIDIVVIKKAKDVVITKNIATIFREYNLVEYKNPTDYVSVRDFYHVYAYACLSASLEGVPITKITLTFVESRHPRRLLAHLKEVRGYTVEERSLGSYTVVGDILPIQIINSRKLSEEENIWFKDLDNQLDVERSNRILMEIERKGQPEQTGAYADVISRANVDKMEEVYQMGKSKRTLEQMLEEVGLTAKWEAQGEAKGREQGRLEVAKNLIKIGLPLEQVAQATEIDLGTVKSLI
jgi:hypothetical protein